MKIQDVDKEFQKRVLKDMRLMEIRSRMRYGTATFADTAEYNDRASSILGSVLSGRMPSTPNGERAKLCEYLLRHLYNDTNEMCAAVQLTLDKALGIQLAPQKAPFPATRVQAISGSLEDQTVPMETIQRRAGSAATVGRSFHDAYIKTNAEFRDRAGLQSSAIREGGAKCCEWCASVSGKYPASDTPQGFWGRHDNCKCSILYETRKGVQRLGGSTKKWEPLRDAGAPEPVRFTAEQAAEREAQHPTIAFTPEQAKSLQEAVLTKPGEGAIMESELGKFRERLRSDNHMDKTYYDTIKTKFSHGSDDAKKAFNKFVPPDSIADSDYAGIAHYDPTTKRIFMSYLADQWNARGGGATWFYEHGHLIDEAAGNLSSDTSFYEALFKDKSTYTSSIIRRHGTRSAAETYSILENELSDFRSQSGVSDIFNGLSAGAIQGCAGHPASYWTKESVVQEAFAHMYEAQFDKVRYEQMKHYFPTALARFEELLGGAVK